MLSVLTGRNHTTVGMACIAEATTGFPGSNGHIPFETATIAEVLGERDVKLKYVYDYLGMGAQTVVSDMTVPAGKHTLGVELTKEDATAQATIGTLNLYIDTKSVGELKKVQSLRRGTEYRPRWRRARHPGLSRRPAMDIHRRQDPPGRHRRVR